MQMGHKKSLSSSTLIRVDDDESPPRRWWSSDDHEPDWGPSFTPPITDGTCNPTELSVNWTTSIFACLPASLPPSAFLPPIPKLSRGSNAYTNPSPPAHKFLSPLSRQAIYRCWNWTRRHHKAPSTTTNHETKKNPPIKTDRCKKNCTNKQESISSFVGDESADKWFRNSPDGSNPSDANAATVLHYYYHRQNDDSDDTRTRSSACCPPPSTTECVPPHPSSSIVIQWALLFLFVY